MITSQQKDNFINKKLNNMKQIKIMAFALVAVSVGLTSCAEKMDPKTSTTDYAFNTGQVGAGTAYDGTHGAMTSSIKFTEDGDNTKLTVTLTNTINGQDYNLHVHDAANPATTPNGTPYNETPNATILAGTIQGNGGTVSKDFTAMHSYAYLMDTYAGGFFVVHDPTQTISTTDLTTYLIVGAFPN